MKTPQRDWAFVKVRDLSPNTKEKSTLLAIAWYADPDGTNAYCSIQTIAKHTGHNARTIKRHIKALNSRCTFPRVIKDPLYITPDHDWQAEAELQVQFQASLNRTNIYSIHVCNLTAKERESITGISKTQLKLALPQKQQLSETTIEERSEEVAQEVKATIDRMQQDLDRHHSMTTIADLVSIDNS